MESYPSDFLESFPGLLVVLLISVIVNLVIIGSIVYLIYFLLTLPMRRKERARLFVNLVELGLKDGHSPETTITTIANCRERSLSVGFYVLASYIQQGMRFSQALEKVPRLVPPQICAMSARVTGRPPFAISPKCFRDCQTDLRVCIYMYPPILAVTPVTSR